ncbi:Proline-rich receptor-like protein kinase perk4 [Trifolium repens]|nr:proline-rich receptor protein kinase PERK4 [Trifolium repens]WJX55538.1 Proline-rich receptor-like protein kinase perk4 [Trifolium repens]
MSSPNDSSPDNATPDNSTPDDADNSDSPPSQPPPSESPPQSPPAESPPQSPPPSPPSDPPPSPSQSQPSPSPPTSNNPSPVPPSPNGAGRSPPASSGSGNSPSPPHKSLPKTSTENSDGNYGNSNNNNNDNTNKAIIGAVLGVGAVLLILVVVCLVCSRKKKRKQMYYYGDHPSHAQGNNNNNSYYNSGPHPNYYGGPHGDHVVRLQNGMGPSGMGPSGMGPSGMGPNGGGGWGAPPPPPNLMNSADMSSNYSTGPPPLPPPSPSLALGLKGGTFTYEELAAATNGFIDSNLIGQGGFGYVHKGVLPSGKEIAVKSLKSGSGQGEREFQAEIDIISRVHHRHLVSLVGYCISGGQRMLVYEFIPNNTMEYHLHGKGRPTMDWPTRMRIAIGSAKGLAYLHEDCHPRIIHRDIKAANVLIDDSFEAKVADFGLAKLTTDNNTHVSTRVMGTFGYLAPEYASSGKLTEKSDVFSFGVMLLELVTGKRPVDASITMDDSLVDWARPLLTRGLEEDGNFGELVDPFLEGNYNPQELARMAACAAASIRHSAKKRPKMSQIVRTLEGDVSLDDLKEGMKPGHNPVHTSSSGSSEYDTMQYNADMQKFRKAVFNNNSNEFGTSSFSSGDMNQTPKARPPQPLL